MADNTNEANGSRYCNRDEHSPRFLKTGHTFGTFHRLWKQSFANIGANSGLAFLMTTSGTLSGLMASSESRLETSHTVIKILQSHQ